VSHQPPTKSVFSQSNLRFLSENQGLSLVLQKTTSSCKHHQCLKHDGV
jgi:hypothetical protein